MNVSLHPVSDSAGELRFAHSRRTALILGLITAAGAAAAWAFLDEGIPRLLFSGGIGAFALTNLVSALYRYELVLDVPGRRWRRRKGFAFAPSRDHGSLDDLRGVVLTVRYVSEGSGNSRRRVPVWFVGLEFAGAAWNGPVVVGMAEHETGAYALLEDYARRLRVDAVDRTADDEVRRAWDALDRPLADADGAGPGVAGGGPASPGAALATAAPSATPPAGSGIETTVDAGRRRITLPPAGFGAGTVVVGLFGLLFAGMGGYFLVAGLGLLGPVTVNGEATTGPVLLMVVVGGAFTLVGLSIVASGIARSRAREWMIDDGHRLLFGTTGIRRTRGRHEIAKGDVEEVTVRSSTDRPGGGQLYIMGFRVRTSRERARRGAVVRVRSDQTTMRLGRRLSPEAKAWLRDALAAMVRDGQAERSA